jgi:mercuric ion binding protein
MCPITVRKAMEGVDGVVDAKIDYDNKTATVTFDDARTSPTEIAKASTEIGYPATLN